MERLTSDFDTGKHWDLIERDKPYSQIYRRLKEYENAEEDGRLVVLPCKVGDTVYEIRSRYSICTPFGDRFDEYSCQGCYEQCDSKKEYIIDEYKIHILEDVVRHIRCNNWGRIIFTTREDAEKALKKY